MFPIIPFASATLLDCSARFIRRSSVFQAAQLSSPRQKRRRPVSLKKSITNDHLICPEDGQRFKSLKRHLRTSHDMTPEQYRQKWHLASDYPMVAPAYAKTRSALAVSMGLGQKRRTRKQAAAR